MHDVERLYRELGRRLRAARRDAELTQAALAERVGVSRTSITNVEQGNQHVPLHVLYDLARSLGVSPASLLPEESALSAARESDDRLIQGLKPKERRQVEELLEQIPDDQRRWVYRVMEGGRTDGNQSKPGSKGREPSR